MKEATGELNATLIVVITVGLLSTFFFTVIWPMLRNNLKSNTKCNEAICEPCPKGKVCEKVTCKYEGKTLECPYKG
ncbi:MAG: hypothetical protein J6W64_01740 [Bacilli bacterium]|nr:hypothetical protein [Bacilli bacterium]